MILKKEMNLQSLPKVLNALDFLCRCYLQLVPNALGAFNFNAIWKIIPVNTEFLKGLAPDYILLFLLLHQNRKSSHGCEDNCKDRARVGCILAAKTHRYCMTEAE